MFAPTNVRQVAHNVLDGLVRVDPGNKAAYDANYASLMSRLADAIKRWNEFQASIQSTPGHFLFRLQQAAKASTH